MGLDPRNLRDAVAAKLGQIELPQLGSVVSLPVSVIHNSAEAEDYFFIFDFEQFVEETRAGAFVRPKLSVWAGRDDFSRTAFARQFRESFAREFDIARAQLAEQQSKPAGWFGFLSSTFRELRGATLSAAVGNVVLLVATPAGKAVMSQILPARWMTSLSDNAKRERSIDSTQARVDTALSALDIKLHAQLYDHAFRHGARGPRAHINRKAWPLPAHVRAHLNDGTSGAWW